MKNVIHGWSFKKTFFVLFLGFIEKLHKLLQNINTILIDFDPNDVMVTKVH